MGEYKKHFSRRTACKSLLRSIGVASVWSTPVVQIVSLSAHAQTSSAVSVVCDRADIVGRWQFEFFGLAASTKEITLFVDGGTDQSFITAWGFSEGILTMVGDRAWLLSGHFNGCDELTGTYINIIVIPPLGNIVIRKGNWIATRIVV